MLLAKGPQIVEAKAGGPLQSIKPLTPEVRANIDYELVDKSIDFMKRQKAAGKPFFLYLPFSLGHVPNLPAPAFRGKSRIGNYGDKLVEGDYHAGQILDTLKDLAWMTIPFLFSPPTTVPTAKRLANSAIKALRTWATRAPSVAGWAKRRRVPSGLAPSSGGRLYQAGHHHIRDALDYGFLPNLRPHCRRQYANRPPNRWGPDVLLGRSQTENRTTLLSLIGGDLVAVRWKQWRIYFTDIHPTDVRPQREAGRFSASANMAGYPKVYNIEMDPHEGLVDGGLLGGRTCAQGRRGVQGNTQESSESART